MQIKQNSKTLDVEKRKKNAETQLWKNYENEDLIYLGTLKSTPGKYFSKSAVCVIGIAGPFCKLILTDPIEMK